MPKFTLKIGLPRAQVLAAVGFGEDVYVEAGQRAVISSSFQANDYQFYLSGRCFSWYSDEVFEGWLRCFRPETAGAWASEIDGDLSIVILDTCNQNVYLISDRSGLNRSYYSHRNGCLYISDSRQELIRLIGAATISSYSAYQLLTLGYVVDPESLLENVYVTTPGQVIQFDASGNCHRQAYFSSVRLDSDYFATERECLTGLDSAYKGVFSKRLGRERIPCVMLSGGIDSLTIMKYVKEVYSGRMLSVTYSFKGLHPNELEPARMAARHFGTEHHEVLIDPDDAAAFFIESLQTDCPDGVYLTSFGVQRHLQRLGGMFDLFTGQDSRLHTPPFDKPRETGIYLNRSPESMLLLRWASAKLAELLPRWPIEGSPKHYLQYWAKNLKPRDSLRAYILEALTSFEPGTPRAEFYHTFLKDLPNVGPADSLQEIFKKYISFKYRGQDTDDMNNIMATLDCETHVVHCPFYDWQVIEMMNRVPYALGMGDWTFKTWNGMPYVRKRIARLLVKDAVPDTLLYRAKKTCPHLALIFNASMSAATRRILQAWLPALLNNADVELRTLIQWRVDAFLSKSVFSIYDTGMLRKIQNICYLASLQQICQNPAIQLAEELRAITYTGRSSNPQDRQTAAWV